MNALPSENSVLLKGKVSRVGRMKVSPGGVELLEFTLAIRQMLLGETSVGYMECLLVGNQAIAGSEFLKIGSKLQLEGSLWSRRYIDRKGNKVSETRFIANRLELQKENRVNE